mmetsp:Transcript_29593/g.54985  ORF Transcript_29593/g.54985 Transcript_29593/m.54985 type:complete len:152 (+) Transcript_29593:1317-1772(+)
MRKRTGSEGGLFMLQLDLTSPLAVLGLLVIDLGHHPGIIITAGTQYQGCMITIALTEPNLLLNLNTSSQGLVTRENHRAMLLVRQLSHSYFSQRQVLKSIRQTTTEGLLCILLQCTETGKSPDFCFNMDPMLTCLTGVATHPAIWRKSVEL